MHFLSLLANPQPSPLRWKHSFDTSGLSFLGYKRLLQYQWSFFLYSSALRNFLTCVQYFSLMVTIHNSTTLKENGITEDIFIKFWALAKSFLYFLQSYPSSVPKTLQSWCWALMAFYHTSLLPLCNVFCHVYEKNLKWL